MVTVVGGGLAGCEAAWQLAERGIDVRLVEQKPIARTPAQSSDALCELVCSNSMRGAAIVNAVGLLKEELRRAGSLILACADLAKVPAGGALAVDRDVFSRRVTERIDAHPRIRREAAVVRAIPDATESSPVILATGPLTGDELAADLAKAIGVGHLAYYDAIAPIVATDSIHAAKVFRQSRWGKGAEADEGDRDATALGDEAYINCPMDEAEYRAFVAAIVAAEKVEPRAFEETKYFEGCLPIEIMAGRGEMTLAFGPMKPVGLTDPRTGKRPFAVVQLRQEDEAATAYNLVGFQTRMTYGAQGRVFRMIPGLEDAEIIRYGSVHRNTFVDAPDQLDERMQLRARPHVYLAGQITGVEGYVESCAGGFVCAVMLAQTLSGAPLDPPPSDDGARRHSDAPRAQAASLPAVEHHVFAHPAVREPAAQKARAVHGARRTRAPRRRRMDRPCMRKGRTDPLTVTQCGLTHCVNRRTGGLMIRKQLFGIAVVFASTAGTTACGLATDGEALEASSSSPIIPTDASVQRIYFNTTNHLAVGESAAAAEIDLIAGANLAIETTSQDSSPLVFEILRIRNDGTTELVAPVHAESGFHLDTLLASSDDAYAIYFPNADAKAQSIEIRLTCNSAAGECTRAGQPGDRCTEVFVCDEGLACSAAAAGPTNAYLAGGVCLTPNGQIVE